MLVLVMFGALVAYTSRWSVFDASALQANKLNARTLLERGQSSNLDLRAAVLRIGFV